MIIRLTVGDDEYASLEEQAKHLNELIAIFRINVQSAIPPCLSYTQQGINQASPSVGYRGVERIPTGQAALQTMVIRPAALPVS